MRPSARALFLYWRHYFLKLPLNVFSLLLMQSSLLPSFHPSLPPSSPSYFFFFFTLEPFLPLKQITEIYCPSERRWVQPKSVGQERRWLGNVPLRQGYMAERKHPEVMTHGVGCYLHPSGPPTLRKYTPNGGEQGPVSCSQVRPPVPRVPHTLPCALTPMKKDEEENTFWKKETSWLGNWTLSC